MTRKQDPHESHPAAPQRNDDRREEAPRFRPDDEVPANRREDSHRGDQDDEQEHREAERLVVEIASSSRHRFSVRQSSMLMAAFSSTASSVIA
jgi:hypothetical protein